MFKRAKVIMLPTNDEAVIQSGELFRSIRGFMGLWLKNVKENTYHPECTKQYLYILSDDKIQVGEWCLNTVSKTVFEVNQELIDLINSPNVELTTNKKIIASTDPKLNVSVWDDFNKTIAKSMETGKLPEPDLKGLPRPSKAFIQKYVELGGIDEVMVEYIVNPLVHETIVEFETRLERGDTKGYDLENDYLPKVSKNNTITIRFISKLEWIGL